jgi:hypothetical protein
LPFTPRPPAESAQNFVPVYGRTNTQRDLEERGYGVFIHYCPNTFNQMEWSDRSNQSQDASWKK